ncbi:hypothetical protein GCM10010256_27380 [Streptomyces coeruleorubidus]|nr:hypothetical protein GCM10010256_27380 [Streptomyces coeruleorubidus]
MSHPYEGGTALVRRPSLTCIAVRHGESTLYSIIVVPPPTTEDERDRSQIPLAPGERLTFGRSASDDLAHGFAPAREDGQAAPPGEVTR